MTSKPDSKAAFLPPIDAIRFALQISEGDLDGGRKVLITRKFIRFLLSLLAERVPFDAKAYLAANPDLNGKFAPTDKEALRHHFLTQGYFEGRSSHADEFDAAWYASRYPDVAAALGDNVAALADHYQNQGTKEWRSPNAAVADEVERWAAATSTT